MEPDFAQLALDPRHVLVPGFSGPNGAVDMQVPCTFDFNVAATKYFAGLDGRRDSAEHALQRYRLLCPRRQPIAGRSHLVGKRGTITLPVTLWREMMESYYPNSVWLNLHRDVFERLYRYKMQHGIPTWEQALEQVLDRNRW